LNWSSYLWGVATPFIASGVLFALLMLAALVRFYVLPDNDFTATCYVCDGYWATHSRLRDWMHFHFNREHRRKLPAWQKEHGYK
jgi:hypothetical protein